MSANRCPIDGCPKGRRSGQLMCKQHWYMVPVELRKRVWATARRMWESTEAAGEWEEARDVAIVAVEEKLDRPQQREVSGGDDG